MKCPFSFLRKSGDLTARIADPASTVLPKFHSGIDDKFIRLEDVGELNDQMRMIGLTEADLALLRKIHPVMEQHMDAIIDSFYQSVLGIDNLKEIIVQHSTIDRLKRTLRDHLLEIFNGKVDESYVS